MMPLRVMFPSLSLWRRGVIVFGLVVSSLVAGALVIGAPPSSAFLDFNQQRLEDFRHQHDPKAPGTVRVVLLGNSRLKNATIDLTSSVQQYGSKRIEIFRLVANWAVFRHFEPLLNDIRSLDPDVYIIQMDLLADETAPTFDRRLALQYLRWLVSGQGAWTWYEPVSEQMHLVCTNESEPDMRARRTETHLRTDPQSRSARLARDFVRDVTATGARILFVSVPKSDSFESVVPSASQDVLSASRSLAQQLPQVAVSPFPGRLPDDHFCDVTHLNSKGAQAYSRWLLDELVTTQVVDIR
jgi:hypothetical protein